jgi:hypothetical protein
MKHKALLSKMNWTIAAIALATVFIAGASFAQQINVNAVPKYTVLHPEQPIDAAKMQELAKAGAALPTWSSSFTYKGTKYPYTMIGTNPAKGSATTTVNMVIIPLIVKVPGQTFDPTKPIQKGCGTGTALKLTEASPIFADTVKYTQGGTNVGTTQYEDAFQRAEFWNTVKSKAPDYHVLLKYKVAATQTFNYTAGSRGTASCGSDTTHYAEVDINAFDSEVQSIITKLKLTANEFPYIMTYDVFETENGGCCVLGYHSVTPKGIVYGTGSYGDVQFEFAHGFTDVITISHEIGETINDPYTNNATPIWYSSFAPQYGCNNSLEIGDPLAGLPEPVKVPGDSHQYYVQDLAFEPWFALVANGKSTSVNKWYSMYGTFKNISTNEHSKCGE